MCEISRAVSVDCAKKSTVEDAYTYNIYQLGCPLGFINFCHKTAGRAKFTSGFVKKYIVFGMINLILTLPTQDVSCKITKKALNS